MGRSHNIRGIWRMIWTNGFVHNGPKCPELPVILFKRIHSNLLQISNSSSKLSSITLRVRHIIWLVLTCYTHLRTHYDYYPSHDLGGGRTWPNIKDVLGRMTSRLGLETILDARPSICGPLEYKTELLEKLCMETQISTELPTSHYIIMRVHVVE